MTDASAPVVTFYVTETLEFRDNKVLVARYQPGSVYRLTEKNKALVEGWLKDGKAFIGAPAGASVSGAVGGKASGTVVTGSKKKD